MLRFEGQWLVPKPGETVLECLERHRHHVPSSCRSGVCQSCILRVKSGKVPEETQVGLKETWRRQGYFLSCLCRQTTGLDLVRCGQAERFESRVCRVRKLAQRVFGVWLARPPKLRFQAGQFIQLVRPGDELTRPYSIASTPDMNELELHVALVRGGRMSQWLAGADGHAVALCGPLGSCFYAPRDAAQPLLLAGSGRGLRHCLALYAPPLSQGIADRFICITRLARETACTTERASSYSRAGLRLFELSSVVPDRRNTRSTPASSKTCPVSTGLASFYVGRRTLFTVSEKRAFWRAPRSRTLFRTPSFTPHVRRVPLLRAVAGRYPSLPSVGFWHLINFISFLRQCLAGSFERVAPRARAGEEYPGHDHETSLRVRCSDRL